MSARRLVLVATSGGESNLKGKAEGNSEKIAELQNDFRRIRDRYAAACAESTRLCGRIGYGLASQSEMDELQAGEFSSAEQAYEDFMTMMDKQPLQIQDAVFGW